MSLRQRIGRLMIKRLPISRRSLDIFRLELEALWQRTSNSFLPGYRRKLEYLRGHNELALNLGSGGGATPGWVNIDVRPTHDVDLALDIRRRLPFSDGQVARVRAEHVVEHLDFRDELPAVLREIHRVLAVGGVLRVVVPDTRRFLEAYLTADQERWQALGWDMTQLPADIFTPMHVVNHIFHQGGEHRFAYDFETLAYALHNAGFREIVRQSYGSSLDPALTADLPVHRQYSFYVEARKGL